MKFTPIIMLMLISVSTHAQWMKGTVVFLNGNEKTGYVYKFDRSEIEKVKFKSRLDDNIQKLNSKELKEISFTDNNGESSKYMYKKPAYISNYKSFKLFIQKESEWFDVFYQGEFNILSVITDRKLYYINWPGEDHAILMDAESSDFDSSSKRKNDLKSSSELVFRGKCDSMVKAISKGTFTPKKIEDIILYYKEHCASVKASLYVRKGDTLFE